MRTHQKFKQMDRQGKIVARLGIVVAGHISALKFGRHIGGYTHTGAVMLARGFIRELEGVYIDYDHRAVLADQKVRTVGIANDVPVVMGVFENPRQMIGYRNGVRPVVRRAEHLVTLVRAHHVEEWLSLLAVHQVAYELSR